MGDGTVIGHRTAYVHSTSRRLGRLAAPGRRQAVAVSHAHLGTEPAEQRGGGDEPAVADTLGGKLTGVDTGPHRRLTEPEHYGERRLLRVRAPHPQHRR